MTPQLIGKKKSQATKKVERFFKERRIQFQFLDVDTRALSERELESIANGVGSYEALLDETSPTYKKRGMAYMEFDPREELLERPELLKVPIVRCDSGVAVQPDDATLKELFRL